MQVFSFRATPGHISGVDRVVELTERQTLADVHRAFAEAFGFASDTPYVFFLNDNAWDPEFTYASPDVPRGRRAEHARLETLRLRKNRRFMAVFVPGHEEPFDVRVMDVTEAQPGASYPRQAGGNGDATALMEHHHAHAHHHEHDHDHDEHDHEGHDHDEHEGHDHDHEGHDHSDHDEHEHDDGHADCLAVQPSARMLELGAELKARLEKGAAADLEADQRIAFALLDEANDEWQRIHQEVEHRVDTDVMEWMAPLPRRLVGAGQVEAALTLQERLFKATGHEPFRFEVPALLLAAGKKDEAVARALSQLEEYADDALMLTTGGEVLHKAGELEKAEPVLRDAVYFAGARDRLRKVAVDALARLLRDAGKVREAEAVVAEERDRGAKAARAKAVKAAEPVKPATPPAEAKPGRNDPCPCGSGKKYKKCHGV